MLSLAINKLSCCVGFCWREQQPAAARAVAPSLHAGQPSGRGKLGRVLHIETKGISHCLVKVFPLILKKLDYQENFLLLQSQASRPHTSSLSDILIMTVGNCNNCDNWIIRRETELDWQIQCGPVARPRRGERVAG